MKKYVRVMADYCSDGLWGKNGVMIERKHPGLNLPNDIIERLDVWQLWHDRDNQDYLDKSERTKKFNRIAFSKEGLKIARDIKTYLGK